MPFDITKLHDIRSKLMAVKSPADSKKDFTEGDMSIIIDTLNDALKEIADGLFNLNNDIMRQHEKIEELQATKRSGGVDNSFINMVLNKIEILKNIIKKETNNTDNQFFSLNLTAVESIENEIKESNRVDQTQLKKLNEIYKVYVK